MNSIKRTKKRALIRNMIIVLQSAIAFLVVFLGIVVYANWAAFKSEVTYALKPKTPPSPTVTPTPTPVVTPEPIFEPAHILIDKIGVDVPLQWDIPVDDTVEALNRGVAHLAGTAKPGEIGNTFISGHSSDFSWKNNPYAAVFSLLPKLVVGDTITVREHGKAFVYQVSEIKIVKPDQVDVVNQTSKPILTLMTCYPIGSTKERYIVHADLKSSPNQLTQHLQNNQTLPEIKFR